VTLAFAGVTAVLAFDLGGTRLKASLVTDLSPGPIAVEPSEGLSGMQAVSLITATGRAIAGGAHVDAVGIAVPGLVDRGRVVALPGKFPGLCDLDLAAELRSAHTAPVAVMNDAVAAALGEAVAGGGRGHDRMAMVTIGTGVGTAVIEDGSPLGRGAQGGGQVAGQMPLNFASEHVDTNGRSDTIEAALAAPRLLALARARGVAVGSLVELADRVRGGDQVASNAVEVYRADLVIACVALIHAFTPSALVIGGGPVSGDADWLMSGVQEAVSSQLWPGVCCEITTAQLGEAAALVGVAAQAARQLNAPT
jgi:glucokinase